MGDLWADEGFGGEGFGTDGFGDEDDWDEGEESLESDLEDGFGDPSEPDEDDAGGFDDDEMGERASAHRLVRFTCAMNVA